jgi:polyisoprenyl-teichoic acid--peptidoglycan teichoic acid transferase
MRISGWLLGFIGFGVLFLGTAVCSFVTFSFTRQTVIDFQETGILLDDPLVMVRCVTVGQCEDGEIQPTPLAENPQPVRITPLFTLAPPTEVVQVIEPDVTATTPANSSDTSVTEMTVMAQVALAQVTPTIEPTVDPAASLPRITDPRQIRILLLGIDQRSETGETGPFRTDTMILMNIDPVRKTVGVLSLPRDLWVDIPNFDPGRINVANFLGDANAYPGGGGPALAMETVSSNFGVRVDKYLLINFDVFTSLVDTIAANGVPVTVNEVIDDPDYPDDRYGTIYVHFDPGEYRMDAETLLQYARTRATEGGDFDRARRQQQVLDALRAEVLSAGGILNFISQAPRLWDELSNNYRTNLEYDEIISLGLLMSEIEKDNIHYAVIDNLYVTFGLNPAGDQQVLYPDYGSISDLIQRVFFPQTQLTPAEVKTRSDAENAQVYVYNGTQIVGLANDAREWLTGQGVSVTGVGNDTNYDGLQTVIRDYGGTHPWTARYIANLMGLPPERIRPGGDGLIAEGIMIVAGQDILPILGG